MSEEPRRLKQAGGNSDAPLPALWQTAPDTVPAAAIPTAKLRPTLPPADALPRRELLARLMEWQAGRQRLVVITAPAGYGKSTLASLWLQELHSEHPTLTSAWLALDAADDTPLAFLHAVAAAIAPGLPAAAARLLYLLEQPNPPLRHAWNLLLAACEALPGPLLLVLDDLHRLTHPDVLEMLATAIERGPAQLHLLLLTRQPLPLPTARFHLAGLLLELAAEDLRLRRAELEALVACRTAQPFTPAEIDLLEQRTGGWLAGVLLLLLARNRLPAALMADTPLEALWRGDRGHVADYLMHEVLAAQREPLRTFLLDCAILERMTPELCAAVSGRDDSAALLGEAVRAGLFLRPVQEGWYAFHHLFHDLLLHECELRTTATQRLALHCRAAAWFVARNEISAALSHLITGGDAEAAADLVTAAAQRVVLANEHTLLATWVAQLPPALVDRRPRLLLDICWLALNMGGDGLPAALLRLERALEASPAAWAELPAAWHDELATLRLWGRTITIDLAGIYADALALLPRLETGNHLALGWAHMAVVMVMAAVAPGTPRLPHIQAALTAFQMAGYPGVQVLTLLVRAATEVQEGRPLTALQTIDQALALVASGAYLNPSDYMDLFYIAGTTHYWLDRIDEAKRYFGELLQRSQLLDNSAMTLCTTCWLQLCAAARGTRQLPTEEQLAAEGELIRRAFTEQAPSTHVLMVEAQVRRWLALGQRAQAWACFRQMGVELADFSAHTPSTLWVLAFLAWQARGHELEQLSAPIEAFLGQWRKAGLPLLWLQGEVLAMQQLYALGQHMAARAHLRKALRLVEQTGYTRLLLDVPGIEQMLRVENTAFALELLNSTPNDARALPTIQLTPQQLRILSLLASGHSNPEIAAQLVLGTATVRWHLTRIYECLGVTNRNQAVATAHALGIL